MRNARTRPWSAYYLHRFCRRGVFPSGFEATHKANADCGARVYPDTDRRLNAASSGATDFRTRQRYQMHTFYQTWVTVQVRQEYLDVQRLTKTRLTRGLTLDGLIEGRVELPNPTKIHQKRRVTAVPRLTLQIQAVVS